MMISDLLNRLGEPCLLTLSLTNSSLFTLYKIIEVFKESRTTRKVWLSSQSA